MVITVPAQSIRPFVDL